MRMARLTATEAARRFFEVLSRVADGETIVVTRAGEAVAVITPPRSRVLTPERFRELIASAPPVDDDFGEDVRTIRREVRPPAAS
jgi:prevent-host-death family protein